MVAGRHLGKLQRHQYDTIRIEEFNVDSKAECVQLNLAHMARKKCENKKLQLKQTNASSHLVQYMFKVREGSPHRAVTLRQHGFLVLNSRNTIVLVHCQTQFRPLAVICTHQMPRLANTYYFSN